jgi:hypothetical protein
MGEGVRGYLYARKQRTSGSKGRTSGAITQQSKGCLICTGIAQWLIQKAEDVRHF